MFNFFSRKQATAAGQISSAADGKNLDDSLAERSLRNQQLRTPSPSVDSAIGKHNSNLSPSGNAAAPGPPITPSPPPDGLLDKELGLITDPAALHSLISSVPPKTLHEYTLAHLVPPARSSKPIHPPSSLTLTHLTSFFSSLTPPPKLHCVRCHKFYYEVENVERSCLVPHEDDSAEVERVGGSKGDTQYETLWGCCGQTVEGDGDMGPPDGWCYEGKHTPDTKRARFRADSTIHDDKLVSCERLKCFDPPVSDASSESSVTSSPRPRKRKRSTRKREEAAEQVDAEVAIDDDDDTRSVTSTRSQIRVKKKLKSVSAPSSPPVASASASASTSKPRKKRAKATHDDKAFRPEASPVDDDEMDIDDSASVVSTTKSKRAPKKAKVLSGEGKGKAKAGPKSGSGSRKKPGAGSVSTVEFAAATPESSSPASNERQRKQSVSFAPDTEIVMDDAPTKSVKPRPTAKSRPKKLEEVVATSVEGEI